MTFATRGNGWIALVAIVVIVGASGGCKEIGETFENVDEQLEQVKRGKKPPPPPVRKRREPPPPVTTGKDWGGRELDPKSPEGLLKAEIVRRLECETKECRKEALTRIRKNADTIIPGLPKLLEGQGQEVTLEAVRLAGLLRDKASVEALGGVAAREDGELRAEAVWAIGSIGDEKGVEQLQRVLVTGSVDWKMRREICGAFAKLGAPSSIEIVSNLAASEYPEVRRACARALGATKSPAAVPPLQKLASDDEKDVRAAAREALGDIPGEAAKRALEHAAKE